jgi:hypothetical protein
MKLILKARTGLVAQKKTITRGGKTFQTTVWVKPSKEIKRNDTKLKIKENDNKLKEQDNPLKVSISKYGEEETKMMLQDALMDNESFFEDKMYGDTEAVSDFVEKKSAKEVYEVAVKFMGAKEVRSFILPKGK